MRYWLALLRSSSPGFAVKLVCTKNTQKTGADLSQEFGWQRRLILQSTKEPREAHFSFRHIKESYFGGVVVAERELPGVQLQIA